MLTIFEILLASKWGLRVYTKTGVLLLPLRNHQHQVILPQNSGIFTIMSLIHAIVAHENAILVESSVGKRDFSQGPLLRLGGHNQVDNKLHLCIYSRANHSLEDSTK